MLQLGAYRNALGEVVVLDRVIAGADGGGHPGETGCLYAAHCVDPWGLLPDEGLVLGGDAIRDGGYQPCA